MSEFDFADLDIKFFSSVHEIEEAITREVIHTDVVLDIGPGIYPSNFFVPKFQIFAEPFEEYVQILQYRFEGAKDVLILKSDALTIAKAMTDSSVDSVFLLDVIEHLDKNEGLELIVELERITRQQIIIFTPLGFMPQHVEKNLRDRWGLNGGSFQEHKSGWLPSDFGPEWRFLVCQNFHLEDANGEKMEKPFGAFYAIYENNSIEVPTLNYGQAFFKETPKDAEITRLRTFLSDAYNRTEEYVSEIGFLQNEISCLKNSKSWKITTPLRFLGRFMRHLK